MSRPNFKRRIDGVDGQARLNDLAEGLVRSDPRYVHYREAVDDVGRMRAHADERNRVFVPPRPLEFYVDALGDAGFEVLDVREETIEAR